jgi:hypothetical protein
MGTAREVGNLWACWVMLECAAWSAMERGDDDLAVQLWHAVDSFADQRGYGQWPVVRDESRARRRVVEARNPQAMARRDTATPWSLTQAIDAALQP